MNTIILSFHGEILWQYKTSSEIVIDNELGGGGVLTKSTNLLKYKKYIQNKIVISHWYTSMFTNDPGPLDKYTTPVVLDQTCSVHIYMEL